MGISDITRFGGAAPTMSSNEIADLTGKRHDHVMRDIRAMLGELHGTEAPKFGGYYTAENGKQNPCFNLPKRETLILVSGYSVAMRAKIIDRWQELESAKPDPAAALSDPTSLRILLLQNVEKVIALEAAAAENAPMIAAFNRIAGAEGSFCLTDAAKALQMRPVDLIRELHAREWIYRRQGSGRWIGHGTKERQGLLTHKITSGTKADGSEWSDEQVRITPKGLAKIAMILNILLGDD
jgi:phage regulator Rha-like protein